MKIKSAVKAMFSDAETGMGAKTDVVAFLKRYSSKVRPVTHYSCRGRTAEVLTKFLGALGMQEGSDFSLMASGFDTEFRQIRWGADRSRLSMMISELSELMLRMPSLFDVLYARLTAKEDVSDLLDALPDTEGADAVTVPARENPRHVAMLLVNKTRQIVADLAKMDEKGCPVADLPNGKYAWKRAMVWLGSRFDKDGEELKGPEAAEAPCILPLPVLEVYARAKGFPGPKVGGDDRALVFEASNDMIDLFRLVRLDERLMWHACLNAPLNYLWRLAGAGANASVNTLRSYFFRTREGVEKADLSNKVGLFVGGNAAVIHGDPANGVDDNVTPAMLISHRAEAWTYVMALYEFAYAAGVGMSCQSRFGVPVETCKDLWCRDRAPRCVNAYVLNHERRWVDDIASHTPLVTAEYALFLGPRGSIKSGFTPDGIQGFTATAPRVTLTYMDESNTPDFARSYLTKEELAAEWFAMTHLDDQAGSSPRCSAYGARDTRARAGVQNMEAFKARMQRYSKDDFAYDSSCAENKRFAPVVGSDGSPRYSPLSAFIDGMCISLRRAWSSDGSRDLCLKPRADGARNGSLVLTNLYSGMFTDLSPDLGSENDDGMVFPNPIKDGSPARSGESCIATALQDTGEEREAMTAFLDRLAAGSMEQVRFAKRTMGTPRHCALVLETNVDAQQFLAEVDTSKLEVALGTVFVQTLMLGRHDPSCAFDDDQISVSAMHNTYMYHEAMYGECQNLGIDPPVVPGTGAFDRTGWTGARMCVTARQDRDGRLVLLFSMTKEMATYARMAYRFRCAFPMETASVKARKFTGLGSMELGVRPDSMKDPATAREVVRRILCTRNNDYDGLNDWAMIDGGFGPLFRGPMGAVPGTAVNKEWFSRYTDVVGRINCSGVFVTPAF